MTAEEQDLIRKLETRVRQLILQDKRLQKQVLEQQQKLEQAQQRIGDLEVENEILNNQYANLKVAKMLELTDGDLPAARARINKLVREVDKCIAIMKTE